MKKVYALISVIFIPVLFFLILEGFLLLFGYGQDYPVFLKKDGYYMTNPSFPKKYFSLADASIPELIEQKVSVKKDSNTFRILSLGGSTTAGFPYEVNINFPIFLKEQLQQEYPSMNIESVNLGISAVNSHTVLDMLEKSLKIDPDLVLIYMGHNEFYGAMGLASTQRIGSIRSLIRLTLWLKEFRFYQLIQDILQSLSTPGSKKISQKTLMSQMIGSTHISSSQNDYSQTIQNFSDNLTGILAQIKERNTPVIIGTVTSNLKDQQPLAENSVLKSNSELADFYQKALNFAKAEKWDEAIKHYSKIIEIDSTIAEAYYQLGMSLLNNQNPTRAKKMFIKARDFDAMPFRAPNEINGQILSVTKNFNTPLAHIDSMFSSRSANGTPGSNLFLEHLHPNEIGYQLIAQSFHNAIIKEIEIFKAKHDNLESILLENYSFTILDQRIGELKVKSLLKGFPFNGRSILSETKTEFPIIDSLANEHIKNGLFWDAAHFELGHFYGQNELYQEALREYWAVLKNNPKNPSALYKLADVHLALGENKLAIKYFKEAIAITPTTAFLFAKLGKALVLEKKPDEAISVLEKVLSLEMNKPTLNPDDLTTLYYLLGLSYAQMGKFKQAHAAVKHSLNNNPSYSPAIQLYENLKKVSLKN